MQVVKSGEAFMQDDSFRFNEWENYWMGKETLTYVAVEGEHIAGSYVLKPNNPGRGAHIANGSYMVNPVYRGKKIGELLGIHSLQTAKTYGYTGIQFNAVVATNQIAIQLWQKLGFKIVGTNPKAFNHPQHGFVATNTMFREL